MTYKTQYLLFLLVWLQQSYAQQNAFKFQIENHNPEIIQFEFNELELPKGGHLQGIQQVGKRHLVIAGSSKSKAYFFIVEWETEISAANTGQVKKICIINDDFPTMLHDHAGGIQITNNILAIGTEGGNDPNRSSVVFYDIKDINDPKPLLRKIDRSNDTAGAIALMQHHNSYTLAVAGWDANHVDFYNTNSIDFKNENFQFIRVSAIDQNLVDKTSWTDQSWGKYQAFNFFQTQNNQPMVVGFHRKGLFSNRAAFFKMNQKNADTVLLQKIDEKEFKCSKRSSFRWGAGVYQANESEIIVWTCQKKVKPIVSLNRFKMNLETLECPKIKGE